MISWIAAVLSTLSFAENALLAEVDTSSVESDQKVTLKITVRMEDSVPVEKPKFVAPDFSVDHEFESNMMNTTIINGVLSTQVDRSFYFVMTPKKEGSFKITKIEGKVGDQNLRAQDIPVTVVANDQGAQSQYTNKSGSGGGGLRAAPGSPRSTGVFMRSEVSRAQVYRGEPVTVSYYLYSRIPSISAFAEKFPTLSGFLKQELDMPILKNQMQSEVVTLDGVAYRKSLMARYQAFPLKDGKLEIDPMILKVQYMDSIGSDFFGEEGESLFDHFFRGMQPKTAIVKSEPIKIDVLPLPAPPAGASFAGIVGKVTAIAALGQGEAKTGDLVRYTVKVEGRANLSNLRELSLQLPDGVEIYEKHVQANSNPGGLSQKIFDFVLKPLDPGTKEIPSVEVVYFSPESKKYEVSKTEAYRLQVTGAKLSDGEAPTEPNNTSSVASPSSAPVPLGIPGVAPLELQKLGQSTEWLPWLKRGLFGLLGALGLYALWLLAQVVRVERKKKAQIDGTSAPSFIAFQEMEKRIMAEPQITLHSAETILLQYRRRIEADGGSLPALDEWLEKIQSARFQGISEQNARVIIEDLQRSLKQLRIH